jgi:hypothetical protein
MIHNEVYLAVDLEKYLCLLYLPVVTGHDSSHEDFPESRASDSWASLLPLAGTLVAQGWLAVLFGLPHDAEAD